MVAAGLAAPFPQGDTTTSDSETLIDALVVTGVGMGVVFVVLTALMIIALLMSDADNSDRVRRFLDRVTGNNTMPPPPSAMEALETAGSSAVEAIPAAGLSGKEVAVIALGIALSRARSTVLLPKAVGANPPASSWLSDGRSRSMDRPSRVSR